MLASVSRATASKSVTRAIVPQLASTSSSPAHNLVTRRFNSYDVADDEETRYKTGTAVNEPYRMRGNFRKGDVYKPADLNDSKPATYSARSKPVDELKILKLNPVVEYKNAMLLSHYITPLGRLMSREQTGLSAKNQRRVTKAVRRARALCIISPTAKTSDGRW
ncbi:hypothetical protein EDD11_004827 [Mortierella claussenii]|nr:hypothetical protein EDD11_004827 [Mortierella claussenii]